MQENDASRTHAVDRLEAARSEQAQRSEQLDTASGRADQLAATVELKGADEQLAAREAWLKWIDRDY